jgi:hypothetical protein
MQNFDTDTSWKVDTCQAEKEMGNIYIVTESSLEAGRWMERAQDGVQWQAVVLAALNLGILLPRISYLAIRSDVLTLMISEVVPQNFIVP